MTFIETKLNYSESMKFVDVRVFTIIENLLRKNDLMPVTLENMLHAYTFLFLGCNEKGIFLSLCE